MSSCIAGREVCAMVIKSTVRSLAHSLLLPFCYNDCQAAYSCTQLVPGYPFALNWKALSFRYLIAIVMVRYLSVVW